MTNDNFTNELDEMYAEANAAAEAEFGSQEESAQEILNVLDVANGLNGYRASFNSFSEMALSDGRVIRRIEQAGSEANYVVIETDVNQDQFMMDNEADWTEVSDDELLVWLNNL